ncbi:hypothetical protein ABK040_014080 [Willaertia magna]
MLQSLGSVTNEVENKLSSDLKNCYYFTTLDEMEDHHEIDKIHLPLLSGEEENNLSILIDNGSYHCRAGWSNEENPSIYFRPLCGKLKANEIKNLHLPTRDDQLVLHNGGYLIGNDLHPLDYLKFNARSPFDNDIITNFDYLEQVFDYIFFKLGLEENNDYSLNDIPILLTESILNPKSSRISTTELLFECYGIPKVCFLIDALTSSYNNCNLDNNTLNNNLNYENSLIIRSGFHSTHILPILNGQVQWNNCKRLNIGGFHTTDFTLKLMQLKYPSNLNNENNKFFIPLRSALGVNIFSVLKAEQLKEKYCYTSKEFIEELERLAKDEIYFNDKTCRVFNNEEQYKYFVDQLNELNNGKKDNDDDNKENNGESSVGNSGKKDKKKSQEDLPKFKDLRDCESWLSEKRKELQKIEFQSQQIQFELSKETKDHSLKSKRSAASAQRKKSKIAAEIHVADDETFENWDLYGDLGEGKKKRKRKSKKDNAKNGSGVDNKADPKKLKALNTQKESLLSLIQQVENLYFGSIKTNRKFTHFLSQFKLNTNNPLDNLGIKFTVERIRIPEIIFQPHIYGNEQIGLIEIIENILNQFKEEERTKLLRNVYLCGGNVTYPGFEKRIENELRKISPFHSTINVRKEVNHETSAWKGIRKVLREKASENNYFISLSEYLEEGGDRIFVKYNHPFSNINSV